MVLKKKCYIYIGAVLVDNDYNSNFNSDVGSTINNEDPDIRKNITESTLATFSLQRFNKNKYENNEIKDFLLKVKSFLCECVLYINYISTFSVKG